MTRQAGLSKHIHDHAKKKDLNSNKDKLKKARLLTLLLDHTRSRPSQIRLNDAGLEQTRLESGIRNYP